MTDDLAACAAAIRTGSRSFYAASRLLPARVRQPALALYAFCRIADDAVDEVEAKEAAVLALRDRLDRVYAGTPLDAPADRAFAAVVREHDLPRALPDALLEGFAWDARGDRYATLPDLRAYAARVAATVGAMMTVLMGRRDAPTLARACDLGVAMQLTNIARDVGEDARAGRLYLPLDWLAEAGLTPGDVLAARTATPDLRALTERLLAEAARLYARALPGVAGLPLDCRPAILAARSIYAAIGGRIAANGFDSVSHRAHTSTAAKAARLVGALAQAPLVGGDRSAAPLPETAFLVEAAARQAGRTRVESLIDLFAELEARDRARRSLPPPGAARAGSGI